MKSEEVKKPKREFNQSKNLVYAGYLFVLAATLLAWNARFQGRLSGFALPSLLAMLAFGFMWVHYLTAYLKTNYEPTLDTKKTVKITQYFVLIAILAHPMAIIARLNQAGYGLPPASYKAYFGTAGELFISLGVISLLAFLAFEFKDYLKKRPKTWGRVLKFNDIAMLLIILHGFKLGFVINSGWFRYVWLGYGLSLLYFFYDKYINKRQLKRFNEGFIVGLVVVAMIFLGLATDGNSMVKLNSAKSETKTASNSSSSAKGDTVVYVSAAELTANNGLNGRKCWVAIDGTVYDPSNNPEWKNGQHIPSGGLAKCGQDLTQVISQSPHGKSVLEELPVVGKLKSN